MSTASASSLWLCNSDATFRVCGSTISNLLQTVNTGLLTVTSDTGQINWSTVTKPSSSSAVAGYEMYNFTDSISTLYIKIEYGTGSIDASAFGLWVTIGTGSNGSGTVTGILVSRRLASIQRDATVTGTNLPSFVCCTQGALWLLAGVGAYISSGAPSSISFFGIFRTSDSSGNNTGDGIEVFSMNAISSSGIVGYATNLPGTVSVSSSAGLWCLVPYSVTSSNYSSGGNSVYQVWRHEMPLPQTFTTALAGTCITSEIGATTTISFPLVGATTRTFMSTGAGVIFAAQASANYSFVLIYE